MCVCVYTYMHMCYLCVLYPLIHCSGLELGVLSSTLRRIHFNFMVFLKGKVQEKAREHLPGSDALANVKVTE